MQNLFRHTYPYPRLPFSNPSSNQQVWATVRVYTVARMRTHANITHFEDSHTHTYIFIHTRIRVSIIHFTFCVTHSHTPLSVLKPPSNLAPPPPLPPPYNDFQITSRLMSSCHLLHFLSPSRVLRFYY